MDTKLFLFKDIPLGRWIIYGTLSSFFHLLPSLFSSSRLTIELGLTTSRKRNDDLLLKFLIDGWKCLLPKVAVYKEHKGRLIWDLRPDWPETL